MIVLGLTGSIGMGKSTTAEMFADAGIAVWDADKAVHRLYGPGGLGTRAIERLVPDATGASGVDRNKLRKVILSDPGLLKQIEKVIHPLVAADRASFISAAKARGETIVLCDIPLLYEGGNERFLDKVIVVTAPADIQRTRVLAREGMTEDAFEAIVSKQMPDQEKRAKADYLIDTSLGLEHARNRVAEIIAEVKADA